MKEYFVVSKLVAIIIIYAWGCFGILFFGGLTILSLGCFRGIAFFEQKWLTFIFDRIEL